MDAIHVSWNRASLTRFLMSVLWGVCMIAPPFQAHAVSPAPALEPSSGAMTLVQGKLKLPISLKCPKFILDIQTIGGDLLPAAIEGDVRSGKPAKVSFAPVALNDGSRLEIALFLEWSPGEKILRKWATFRLDGATTPRLLKEVILDEIVTGKGGPELAPLQAVITFPQSYPIFFNGFFTGIEFPVSATRLESGRAILAHMPGLKMQPGVSYTTRKAIYGVAPLGKEKAVFQSYIMAHCPGGASRKIIWDSWVSLPVPFNEAEQLGLIQTIDDKLYKRHGVSVDAVRMDLGWSNPKSIWEIDKALFPDGFTRVREAARAMKSRLGLWISPSGNYPQAIDNEWAKAQGYETFPLPHWWPGRFPCLGGKRYQQRFKERLLDMIARYDIRDVMFDGYHFECPEANHGHEPGPLSSEAIAEGIIDVMQAMRKASPDIWVEPTCFGGNASPWWLFQVTTVLGAIGDDHPWGRSPAPVYRESYTTARDYYNLQGAYYSILPIAAQEVFGGLYNHSVEPFVNDAVMGVMRGNMMYMICANPRLIDDYGWEALAGVLTWSRTNARILKETQPLLPASWQDGKCPKFISEDPMPREPYGYAHWQSERGLVVLRNPWIVPQIYHLGLGKDTDLPATATGLSAVSLYPENRVYGRNIQYGGGIDIPLKPYETLVLSIVPDTPGQKIGGIGDIAKEPFDHLRVAVRNQEVRRVELNTSKSSLGPDWTSLTGESPRAISLKLDAAVTVKSPRAELLILNEDTSPPMHPLAQIQVNGKEAPYRLTGPDTGYAGDGHPRPEQWLFLRIPLAKGENQIKLDLLAHGQKPKVSVWAWAFKDGRAKGSAYPNSLPQPEIVSLASAEVAQVADFENPSIKLVKMDRPIQKIQGTYLDAIEPATSTTPINKNTNPDGKLMLIGGKRFLRGLGVVAPSRLAFMLDGGSRRFQATVGADSNPQAADKTRVAFEVWADGRKLYDSGMMTRWDRAKPIDLEIDGTQKLELVVIDHGLKGKQNQLGWADWAEARLLR